MPAARNRVDVSPETKTLTTAYASGWTTPPLNVAHADQVTFLLDLEKGSATTLTLKLVAMTMVDDQGEQDPDDEFDVLRVASGVAEPEEVEVTLAEVGNKVAVSFNVLGLSRVRLAAKVDATTGDPEMTAYALEQAEVDINLVGSRLLA